MLEIVDLFSRKSCLQNPLSQNDVNMFLDEWMSVKPFDTLGVGPTPLVPDWDLTLEWPLKGILSQN